MINTDYRFPDLSNAQGGAAQDQPKRPLLTRLPDTKADWVLQLDNTTLSIMQTCFRAVKHYAIHRRQRPDRSALIMGGAIHKGLEVIYRDGMDQVAKAKQAILTHFEQNPYNFVGEWRTPSFAIDAFTEYVEYWQIMDTLKPITPSWVEKAFSLNIGSFPINTHLPYSYDQLTCEQGEDRIFIENLHVQWCGKIDLVVQNDSGQFFVVDHKTTSIGGPTFFEDFILAQQTHGYMWAGQKILNEFFAGFILNALILRKPAKIKGKGNEFDRKTYYYTQESIDDWELDIKQTIDNFVHALIHNAFPKGTAWCMGKYGKCQYHDVCTLPNTQQAIMLFSDMYANVTWSPLDVD